MNLLRKTATTLGGIFFAVLLIAALAPKATRGIAAALVQVTNTASSPVPNRDVDNPATEPFDASLCNSDVATGDPCSGVGKNFTVPTTTPDGRAVARAVIEQVSGNCLTTETRLLIVELSPVGGAHPSTYLPTPIDTNGNSIFSLLVKMYLNPGEEVAMASGIAGIGDFTCNLSVVGHLVAK
jgi:hypothetical protein